MKRVDNSDVTIKLDSRIVYLSDFNIKFYTVNAENFFIRKNQDDVLTSLTKDNKIEYCIKIDWNELVTLGEGVLQYDVVNNIPDSDRVDLYYNEYLGRTTNYYINSNVTVDPESEESYAEVIAELGVKIDTEIARSTSADTVHDEAIQDEVITRQQNVSDLTDLISANTSGITQNRSDIGDLSVALSNEITNRQNADEAISGAVDTVLANYLTISAFTEAEEIISASLNDLNDRKLDASAYTPTDLSNYYTKSEVYDKTEVDNAIAAIDVSEQLEDYLKISAFTQAEQTINNNINAISGSVGTKLAKSDFNTYSAATNTKINSKLDASAYTPTDLTSYYTKSETDNLVDAETTRATNAESALSTSILSKYEKPSGGIPKSDLESSVQTSLGLADTALQSFTETDPTVPSWAKAQNKPTYTADEINDTTTTNKFVTEQEKTIWNNKQDTLVSGTNIKTINNQSIIGSGNIEIQGGGSIDPTQYYTKEETDDLLAAIEMGQIGYIDAGDY